MLVACPRNQLNRPRCRPFPANPCPLGRSRHRGQIAPLSSIGQLTVLPVFVSVLPIGRSDGGSRTCFSGRCSPWMPTLRRTANRQNPNDFFSRTPTNSETAVLPVLRQRLFWDSFETVGLLLACTCARILGNFSRGVAQPGSAPALGAGGRWFESSRPDQSKPLHHNEFSSIVRFGLFRLLCGFVQMMCKPLRRFEPSHGVLCSGELMPRYVDVCAMFVCPSHA